MKKIFPLLVLAVVIAGGYYGIGWWQKERSSPFIFLSGNIETDTVEVSFKIPGRVIKRLVDEGEIIRQGELVAKLDSSQLRDQWMSAVAQTKAAQAAYEELLSGSRPEEIAAARDAVRQRRAQAHYAKTDFIRLGKLYRQDLLSAEKYDEAKTNYQAAAALLRQNQDHLQLALNGPRIEDIQQARHKLQAAKGAEAQAQSVLDDAAVRSPISGVVLSKNVEPGDFVSAGTPVVTVADLNHVYVRAYLDESELGRVKLGEPAQVTTDTFPGKIYKGRVAFISSESEFTPKNIQTQNERVNLVYRMKVDVENPNQELKPGMPADVKL